MDKRVIVVGVDENGRNFVQCMVYKNETKLEEDMRKRFSCKNYMVLYSEDIPMVVEAIEDYYCILSTKDLTPEDERCIKNMLSGGYFFKKEVAKNYGIKDRVISHICNKGKINNAKW